MKNAILEAKRVTAAATQRTFIMRSFIIYALHLMLLG
jgi:hypothetical protein